MIGAARQMRRTDLSRSAEVDRALGLLISLSVPVLIVAEFARFSGQVGSFAPWWTAGSGVMVLLAVVAAAGGRVLPDATLRVLWATFVVLLLGAESTVFLAYRGPDPDALFPWVWRYESIAVCYLVLLVPPVWAAAAPLLIALLPAASGLVFLGRVPDTVAAQTPLHLGNIVFAVLFLAMRSRLVALSDAERVARDEERRRALLDAHAEREEQFSRLVHDELLSVFSAALHVSGPTSSVLRISAERALDRLRGALEAPTGDAPVAAPEALRLLSSTVRGILPAARLTEHSDGGAVPSAPLTAVCGALAEAARNTARHAPGSIATLHLDVGHRGIRASLSDNGPGFELAHVPAERLGVNSSILGRMRSIPGGRARVDASASGTRVDVEWSP